MSDNKPNPLFDAAKGFATDFLRSKMPKPQGNEPMVITVPGVLRQLTDSIERGTDPEEPIRLSLMLAAIIASQRGWKLKDALLQAGIAWEQTAGLRKTQT